VVPEYIGDIREQSLGLQRIHAINRVLGGVLTHRNRFISQEKILDFPENDVLSLLNINCSANLGQRALLIIMLLYSRLGYGLSKIMLYGRLALIYPSTFMYYEEANP
jgi:hypothetical protein